VVSTNLTRIMDGVVVLDSRVFNPAGYWLNGVTNNCTNNAVFFMETAMPDESRSRFVSNAVPAYVEFELGVLEPTTLDKLRSLPSALQPQFLASQVNHVHLFRQRVAVRNVDRSAYDQ